MSPSRLRGCSTRRRPPSSLTDAAVSSVWTWLPATIRRRSISSITRMSSSVCDGQPGHRSAHFCFCLLMGTGPSVKAGLQSGSSRLILTSTGVRGRPRSGTPASSKPRRPIGARLPPPPRVAWRSIPPEAGARWRSNWRPRPRSPSAAGTPGRQLGPRAQFSRESRQINPRPERKGGHQASPLRD